MGCPAPLLNTVTKPISVLEFKEAIDAICRPKFPTAVWARARPPALAISGGVDSMALAYLWSKTLKMFPGVKVADYPTPQYPHAIVVDHGLRDDSAEEAIQVARQLNKLGFKTVRHSLKWRDVRRSGLEPRELPNVESMARTLRYQQLATSCAVQGFVALFTAHHRDDQYETILMRLMSGQGYRGIQGMRLANDVPECHGIHKAHKSGFLDDQKSLHPYLNFRPSTKTMRHLKHILKEDTLGEDHMLPGRWKSIDAIHFHGHVPHTREPGIPHLTPLDCEDGGITVYRPLLDFDKDRLIATCEANNVPWFEDPTNKDETMTMRNAVRHLVRNYTLPVALRKPAILDLAARAKRRADLEEAEARRLLQREAVIREFDSCAGTLIAEMPSFLPKHRRHNRLYTRARIEAKKARQRIIAALVIRVLIDYVTPNEHLPPLSNLESAVARLFPELDPSRSAPRPVGFSLGGVVFEPIITQHSVRWFLSRAPYNSKHPLPEHSIDWRGVTSRHAEQRFERDPTWSGWRKFPTRRLWDGRFWVQVHCIRHVKVHIRPFQAEHSKPFRTALPRDQAARLEAVLQHYAPSKIRYTLPGIYISETTERGVPPRSDQLTLLALPTLGIHLPGLTKWLKYEVSYKKVDLSLLALSRRGRRQPLRGYQPAYSQSRRQRTGRQRRIGTRGPRDTDRDGSLASNSAMTWVAYM